MAHPISEKRIIGWFFGVVLVYLVSMSCLAVLHHRGLRTTNDLSNSAQAIWRASHGDLTMRSSNSPAPGFYSRLQMHLNLIYWLIAPVYRFLPDPKLLLILSTMACAGGGVGLYLYAKRRLGSPYLAVIPGLVFLASPMVHDANLFDFKVIVLAACFIIWMIWAFDSGRERLGWVFFALALICQEDIAPVLMVYGVICWLEGNKGRAWICLAVPAAYLIAAFFALVPLASGNGAFQGAPDGRYHWLLRATPQGIFDVATSPDHLRLPLYLLLSGAVAARGGWPYLLLLVPHLLGGIFSQYTSNTRLTGSYYWVVCEAAIILGCIAASARARRIKGVPVPLLYLACSTLFFSLVLSPAPYNGFVSMASYRYAGEDRALAEAVAQVPPDAAVSAQNNLTPHLAHRPVIGSYPNKRSEAEYLLFHMRFNSYDSGITAKFAHLLYGMFGWKLAEEVRLVRQSKDWGLVYCKDGFYLFRKGKPHAFRPDEIDRMYEADLNILKLEISGHRHRYEWVYYLSQPFTWQKLEDYLGRLIFKAAYP